MDARTSARPHQSKPYAGWLMHHQRHSARLVRQSPAYKDMLNAAVDNPTYNSTHGLPSRASPLLYTSACCSTTRQTKLDSLIFQADYEPAEYRS